MTLDFSTSFLYSQTHQNGITVRLWKKNFLIKNVLRQKQRSEINKKQLASAEKYKSQTKSFNTLEEYGE